MFGFFIFFFSLFRLDADATDGTTKSDEGLYHYNIKTLPEIIQKEAALYNSMLNRKKCKRFND